QFACLFFFRVLSMFTLICYISFKCYVLLLHLHSFPTRRSSDLTDLAAISKAIDKAQAETDKPTLIEVKTVIGLGSPKQGTSAVQDRKSTRLNSSHVSISYAVFCLKKKI